MTLADLIDAVDAPSRTVTVINCRQPDPVYGMLADFFGSMDVDVREASLADLELPDVVTVLGNVRFPGDAANKLTFVRVSRHVEAMAHDGGDSDAAKAALVAADTYRGFWTFDPNRVAEVLSYVRGTYPEPG